MNTLKTLIVAAVLSTLAYGVYSNYTARAPLPPPSEAGSWDQAPQVQLPPAPPQFGAMSAPAALPPPPAGTPLTSGNLAPLAAPLSGPSLSTPFEGSSSPSTPPGMPVNGPSFPALPLSSTPTPSASPTAAAPTVSIAPPANSSTANSSTAGAATIYPSGTAPASNPNPSIQISSSAPPAAAPALVSNPYASASPVTPTSLTTAQGAPSATPAGIIPAQPQDSQRERFIAAMGQVQGMLDQGQLAPALLALSEWHDDPSLPPDERAQLLELLDRLAGTVIYSREHLLDPPYVVQPGDNLLQIADRFQVPWQLLAKINGLADPQQLRPGDRLKAVRGPFDAVVNLRTGDVTLLLRGHYAGRFPCAIGQDAATPVGEYSVREKRANPIYYGPSGVIDADDPSNPLGERLLDLGSRLSLHGCNAPEGLSPNETRGCIRLSNADADDLFDILSVNSRVVVKR